MKSTLIILSIICLLNANDNFLSQTPFSEKPSDDELKNKIVYVDQCQLFSSFSGSGQCSGSAIDSESWDDECKTNEHSRTCLSKQNDPTNNEYLFKIDSEKTFHDSMSTVVSVEGGEALQKVSVGASFMMDNTYSKQALTFTTGGHKNVETQSMKFSEKAKLSDYAKQILKEDPYEFIDQYGVYYVSQINMGGTFFASVRFESDSSNVDVEGSVGTNITSNELFAGANVAADIKTNLTSHNVNIEIKTNLISTGSDSSTFDINNATGIYQSYQTWKQNFNSSNAVKTVMLLQKYTNMEEFKSILHQYHKDKFNLFDNVDVYQETYAQLQIEKSKFQALKNRQQQVLNWNCLDNYPEIKKNITDQNSKYVAYTLKLQSIKFSDILKLQDQLFHSNKTFFQTDQLKETLDGYLSKIEKECAPVCFHNKFQRVQHQGNDLTLQCSNNNPMTGIQFNHMKPSWYTYQQNVGQGCLELNNSNQQLSLPLTQGSLSFTKWQYNYGEYNAHKCFDGQYVTQIQSQSDRGSDRTIDRRVRLVCISPNQEKGYKLDQDNCYNSEYLSDSDQQESEDPHQLQCRDGYVMTELHFLQNKGSNNYIQDEKRQIVCCPLKNQQISC